MGDEAHIGLVDPHPERHRRDDDHVLARHELRLVAAPHVRIEPGMIGEHRAAGLRRQLLRELLHALAGLGIDNAGAGIFGDDVDDLPRRVFARHDMVADVRPVKAGDDQPVLRNPQLFQNIGAGMRVGRGGKRQARHLRKAIEQRTEQPVIGAEIMPPFRNAMRLVDCEQAERRLRQQVAEALARGTFGRDVEQVELAGAEALDRLGAIVVDAGQRCRANAHRLGGAQLVVHQRDQRADDDAGPLQHHRGQLVGERLARAGGHHRQRALPRHHAVDHRGLHAAKGVIAENPAEMFNGIGTHGCHQTARHMLALSSKC